MKTITPVSAWHNGSIVSANKFLLYCIMNDLDSTLNLYYELRTDTVMVASGNLTLNGTDYPSMNSSTDSAEYCWNWAATELGLTII
jgi:hypothetical protein